MNPCKVGPCWSRKFLRRHTESPVAWRSVRSGEARFWTPEDLGAADVKKTWLLGVRSLTISKKFECTHAGELAGSLWDLEARTHMTLASQMVKLIRFGFHYRMRLIVVVSSRSA